MDGEFLDKLDVARHDAEVPFKITSGYRCPTMNLTVGGKPNSAHVRGQAADIWVVSSRNRFKILRGLISAGFHRIGIGYDFIHVDDDDSKVEDVIWHYYD
jgi:uncharacterized protein YcbK (DUF882 family)